ncbi:distal tail protein Dit [Cytobacillus oceanisediminis]|uniref:distal tail protein Dit n=1 Tax=Cytobacillus oceanisediminis TaxID=665099 RepID=UPI002079B008|nr:distal tail protein Dit [Cytobacillus oceanisediminis]MBY0157267.1 phage tail family protein [Cytobacillus firmus]USK46281.1 phage tail family protein [Cytobacillus oceanisediminis]
MGFTFNGIKKEYVVLLASERRPAFAPVKRNLLTVPGMPGAHLVSTDTQVRVLPEPVLIDKSLSEIKDIEKIKEDLADWLVTDQAAELIFDDEPDRVYYAVVDGSLDIEDLVSFGRGQITFICPDPYKYGEEKTDPFPEDGIIINNGSADTPPIINLEVTEKITFAMVQKGVDEYMLIGEPVDVTATPVDTRTLLLSEDGSTINTWQPVVPGMGSSEGTLGYDGAGITAPSYGTGSSYHGPFVYKEVPLTGDFEVELRGQLLSGIPETGRVGFSLFDDQLRNIAMMNAVDIITSMHRKSAEGRVGPYVGDFVNYPISSRNYRYEWENFPVYLRLKRLGDTFEFYVARIMGDGTHMNPLTQTWTTVNDAHRGQLKYVGIFIEKHGSTPSPHTNRIDYIRAYSLSQITVDQTPYIAYPGDVITFNHKTKDILINGIDRTDLKAFGARYFSLEKGKNLLTLLPQGAFNASVTLKERYK